MPSNRFGSGIRILAELGQVVAPGAHGIVLMDEAGWHTASDQLTVRLRLRLRLKDHLTLRRKQFLLDITTKRPNRLALSILTKPWR